MNFLINFVEKFIKYIEKFNPVRFLAFSFLFLIVLGAFLLKLPVATTNGISFTNAFFTSTSAVCVTGLIAVDTPTAFTLFGKIVILFLIQFGAIGIMTFAAFFIWLVRQKISLSERMMLEYAFLQTEREFSLKSFLFFIFRFTFIAEFFGAIAYFFSFKDLDFSKRVFFSVFHSISAFCNAGFSLYSDSLMKYSNSIAVNLITISLIFMGGIGFIVVFELRNKLSYLVRHRNLKYRAPFLSLHSYVVLWTTVILILFGALAIFFSQYFSNGQINFLQSLFQSVTCRTAGFNTVDVAQMSRASILIMEFLMFIGGSPGSTAGGIKTTTIAVLFFMMFMGKNNFEDVTARERSLPKNVIFQALLVFQFSLAIISLVLLLLVMFEPKIGILQLSFETVSAFGTVGLSMDTTMKLSNASKYVLMFAMFAGRVGSLTIFSLFMNRKPLLIKHAEERILIG